ncbi:hypothetical protein Q1695_002882 [Nippostrongylus brasiliensis]|nr:hypothetical protein Q1695_002882 [Nippostrongylus brasiliensis]
MSRGYFTVFEAEDPFIYDSLLVTILISAVVLNIILFIYGMVNHTPKKKSYVVVVLGFHIVVAIPFFLSGFYLHISVAYADEVEISRSTKDHVSRVITIQDRFCCCGLDAPEDWGKEFEAEDVHNVSVTDHGAVLACPSKSAQARFHCSSHSFEGCHSHIINRKQRFILISSAIGLGCAIAAVLISPCIYASFEYDRRSARARYIRQWRAKLDVTLEQERLEDDEEDVIAKPPKPLSKLKPLARPTFNLNRILQGTHGKDAHDIGDMWTFGKNDRIDSDIQNIASEHSDTSRSITESGRKKKKHRGNAVLKMIPKIAKKGQSSAEAELNVDETQMLLPHSPENEVDAGGPPKDQKKPSTPSTPKTSIPSSPKPVEQNKPPSDREDKGEKQDKSQEAIRSVYL